MVAELQVSLDSNENKRVLNSHLYSISAVLMQIRLAISNLEPRPARLARNWNEYAYCTFSVLHIAQFDFLGPMVS